MSITQECTHACSVFQDWFIWSDKSLSGLIYMIRQVTVRTDLYDQTSHCQDWFIWSDKSLSGLIYMIRQVTVGTDLYDQTSHCQDWFIWSDKSLSGLIYKLCYENKYKNSIIIIILNLHNATASIIILLIFLDTKDNKVFMNI